jgi:hypothetical protein
MLLATQPATSPLWPNHHQHNPLHPSTTGYSKLQPSGSTLHTMRDMDILTVLFFLLGLTISWLPLTLLLFSTLTISICLTAKEIEANHLQFEEQMANNQTQTTRQQQQHYPLQEPPAHASFPLHIPPGTSLLDISDLTLTLLLQVQQQHQRTPTQGHTSNTIPTTDDTPSWPWTLAIHGPH